MFFIYVVENFEKLELKTNVKGVILPDLIRFKKEVVQFIKQKHAFVYPCVEGKEKDEPIKIKKSDTTGHTGWLISETDIFAKTDVEEILLPKDQVKRHKMANANDMNALSIAYCSIKE